MLKRIRRNLDRKPNGLCLQGLTNIIPCLALAYTLSVIPAYSQDIIIDGKTKTTLSTSGITTNVSTSTIKGSNAFNSFVKFNVAKGKIVNLNVPNNASTLINLVHDESTSINGVLNSIKAGKVGGNIFLVNPHGITVGAQGVVNVGSLTAVTPTQDFMNGFFDNAGLPDDDYVSSLINGTAPVNPDAQVINNGVINAIENVKIDTGSFSNAGDIYSGAKFNDKLNLEDVVNLNTLESGEYLTEVAGKIEILATKDIVNSGRIVSDGADNVSGGYVSLVAGNDITLKEDSLISAKGRGENSNAGEIYIWGDNDSYFYPTAILDTRGGEISGDAGTIELSAKDTVYTSGKFKATATDGKTGHIIIDPLYVDSVKYTGTGYVSDALIYTDGANLTISATNDLTTSAMTISTRKIAAGSAGDQLNDASTGNSGSLTLTASTISLSDTDILTFGSDGYSSGDINLDASVSSTSDSSMELTNTSLINAGNATLTINAGSQVTTTHKSALTNIDNSTVYAGTIDINSYGGNDDQNGTDGYAYTYVTDSIVRAQSVNIDTFGGIVSTSDPTANAEAKIFVTNSDFDGYSNIDIDVQGGSGFNSDAIITLTNVDTKTTNMDVDITTGDSIGAQGTFTGANFDFEYGGLDITASSANGSTAISFDAASGIDTGTFAKTIVVNADGTIDTAASNVGATSATAFIEAADISSTGVSLNADSVTGAGEFEIYKGYSSVNVTNNSSKELRLNNITTDQSGYFKVNGTDYDSYGSFDIDVNESYSAKTIQITNSGSDDISLYGLISNNSGSSVSITANSGNILDGSGAETSLVEGTGITLSASSGSIGLSNSDIEISLLGNQLSATASGYINITNDYGDLDIDTVNTSSDATLTATAGNIIDSSDDTASVVANNLILYANNTGCTIGTSTNPLNLSNNTSLKAYANGLINIKANTGHLNLKEVKSTNDSVTLYVVSGNITDAPGSANDIVVGYDLNFYAPNGSIGQADDIDLINKGSGVINAYANGYIRLQNNSTNSSNRDLNIGQVESVTSTVYLQSIYGSVLDASVSEDPNVIASTVMIDSDGTIGTSSDYLDIQATSLLDYASGDDGVYIVQTTGDLTLDYIRSAYNNIYITTLNGSMFDTSTTDMRGKSIILTAGGVGSTIGTSANTFKLNLQGNNLTANADGIINITESSGNLSIAQVISGSDDVKLYTSSGSITETSPNSVQGNNLTLSATNGNIGTTDTAFAIDNISGTLNASASGSINIIKNTTGDIDFGAIQSTGGELKLTVVNGSIVSSGAGVAGTNILLYANGSGRTIGTSGTALDMSLVGGYLIAEADGIINLNATSGDVAVESVVSTTDDVIITTVDGSITENNTLSVSATDITLTAGGVGKTIGTSGNDFAIDLSGQLYATADGLINIIDNTGDLDIDTVNSNAAVTLKSVNGSIYDNTDVADISATDLTLYASTSGQTIGTEANPLNIYSSGGIKAYANGLISLKANTGHLNLIEVKSTSGDVILNTLLGDITDAPGSANDIVVGYNLTFNAPNGSIGQADDIDLINKGSGVINAYANGYIRLQNNSTNSSNRDLNIGQVESVTSTAYLQSIYGSVLDASASEDPNVIATTIMIDADGTIGTSSDYLDIQATSLLDYASGDDGVYITQTSGDLTMDYIRSAYNNIYITTLNGSMFDTATTDIRGKNISLIAGGVGSTIGTSANTFKLNLQGNNLTAKADGIINITESSGNLLLESVESYNDNVKLIASTGSILDSNSNDDPVITANDITLVASSGTVGTSVSPVIIDLATSTLSVTANGDIYIEEYDSNIDLLLAQSTGGGNVSLLAPLDITVLGTGVVSGDNITLSSDLLEVVAEGEISAVVDINLIADKFIIDTGSVNTTVSGSTVTLSRNTAGDLTIDSTANNISPVELAKILGNKTIGNSVSTNTNTANILIDSSINITEEIIIDATDSITVSSGNSITTSVVGDSIVINANDGNFINNSGAGVFSATNGRWLVYSGDPATTTEGGLAYNKSYNKTYTANPPASIAAGNWILYSIAPELTFTAENKSRTYGDANPAFTYVLSGLIDGDVAGDAYSGIPSITTPAINTSNVGTYAIDIEQGTVSLTDLGYTINSLVDGTLTVNKAQLTVSAANSSIEYGDSTPAYSAQYTGFKNGETIGTIADYAGSPTLTGPADISTWNVGTYNDQINITGTTETSTNYNFVIDNTNPADVTITKATLTVFGNDISREYGENTPGYSVGYSGFKNGETIGTIAGYAGSPTIDGPADTSAWNVGIYADQIDVTGTTESATNYNFVIDNADPGDITVTPATLTVTPNNATIIYGDGAPVYTSSYSGFKNGETIGTIAGYAGSPTLTGPVDVATRNVGVYGDVIDITGTTETATNYVFVINNLDPGDLTINKATLTVTPNNVSREYGENTPAYSAGYSGFKNGETIGTISGYSGSPNLSGPVDTSAWNVNIYADEIDITGTTEISTNYNFVIDNADPGDITVTTAPLTVTTDDSSKIYGSVNPSFTASYSGFKLGQDQSDLGGSLSFATAATQNSDVGVYGVTPSGYLSTNYNISYVDGDLTINKADLTVNVDNKSKTYGAVNPPLTASYSGFVLGQDDSVLGGSITTTATQSSDVGLYNITGSTLTSGNYNITSNDADLTVNKADLTVNVDDKSKTYGDVNPALTASYSGFVLGQDDSVLGGSITTTATQSSDVNVYNITGSTLTSGNYNIISNDGDLTINEANLTVNVDNKSKTYGSVNPTLTASYTGFVLGQDESVLGGSLTTTATQSSDVNTYNITGSTLTSGNYNIISNDGTLTVNKANLTVTADNKSKIYGDANPVLTESYSGFVLGQDQSVLGGTLDLSTTATQSSDVGTYGIVPSGYTSGNYNISYVDGNLIINKADLTVNVDDKSKIYGSLNPALTASYSGFVLGQDESVLGGSLTTTAIQSSDVGSYNITGSALTSGNYNITSNDGSLTINKADLTVNVDDKSKTYGSVNPALTAGYSGFVLGQDESVLGGSITTTATQSSDAGVYNITGNTLTSGNYNIISNDGDLTINKANLIVNVDDKSKTYGSMNPAFTASYSGFVLGQDKSVLGGSITTTATQSSDVGIYNITGNTLTSGNYNIISNDGDFTINKANLTVIADDKSKIYGAANPILTASYEGFVLGQNQNNLGGSLNLITPATQSSNVGSYDIIASGYASNNYNISYVDGDLAINQAPLTIKANNASRAYGSANPAFSTSYNGFVLGQDQSVLGGSLSLTTLATQSSNVGNYSIMPSGNTSSNYNINFVDGNLAIKKVDLRVNVDNKTKTYGAVNPALTARYSGFVLGQDQSVLGGLLTTIATQSSSVGTYPITADSLISDNYNIISQDGILTVIPTPGAFDSVVQENINVILDNTIGTYPVYSNYQIPGFVQNIQNIGIQGFGIGNVNGSSVVTGLDGSQPVNIPDNYQPGQDND